MNIGIWELVIILVIVALLFGTKKLGSIGADVGNAIKGFRSAMRDDGGTATGAAPKSVEKDAPHKDQGA
jgi:sec-independent protein translocase protein TatA